jgi:alpha-glucosidase
MSSYQSAVQDLRWWQRGVFYEIYVSSFKDTTGNGIGDLNGIIDKLDYLNNCTSAMSLGIDAIWITPFYPSPMADFGYDVSDYCNVNPLFGSLTTFDSLVTKAHQRNIKIIIDYVPNHTSNQHPWFIESSSSCFNPKRDWYIWQNPKPVDGKINLQNLPNNWGSYFGGPAWTFDKKTGQYYLHQFAKEQPELNWRNPEVRRAMMDVLRFWLDRGVDGIRMDVIELLIKDAQLRDNPLNPDVAMQHLSPNDISGWQLHIYNQDQEDVHKVIREIRQVFEKYDDRCSIGETWWSKLPRWVKYYGINSTGLSGNELHMPFNFRLMKEPWEAQAVHRSVDDLESVLPKFAWPNYVLGNHDQKRLASRIGGQAQARLAAVLLLTLRGTPTLYYGDELGMEDGVIPPENIKDPQGINLGAKHSRDACRTPMQWEAKPNAGFCAEGVNPWLPVSGDYATRNVEVQSVNPTSILNLYRRLLALRRSSQALQHGSYCSLDGFAKECFVYLRKADDEQKMMALNFSQTEQTVSIQDFASSAKILLSTHLDREECINLRYLRLRPYEGCIIALNQ